MRRKPIAKFEQLTTTTHITLILIEHTGTLLKDSAILARCRKIQPQHTLIIIEHIGTLSKDSATTHINLIIIEHIGTLSKDSATTHINLIIIEHIGTLSKDSATEMLCTPEAD